MSKQAKIISGLEVRIEHLEKALSETANVLQTKKKDYAFMMTQFERHVDAKTQLQKDVRALTVELEKEKAEKSRIQAQFDAHLSATAERDAIVKTFANCVLKQMDESN